MAHTNSTQNYNLPQWIGSDKPTFLGDFNNAFSQIDSQIKVNSDSNLENADNISAVNTLATTNRDNLAALANRVTDAEGDITEANANIQANATSIDSITDTLSSMNTLIQGKQNLITGAGSTITTNNLTSNKVLVSDSNGKVSNATVSATELSQLSGVTSNLQEQLNALKSYSTMNLNPVNGHSDYCVLSKAGHVVTLSYEWDGWLSNVTAFEIPVGYRPITRQLQVPVSANQRGQIEMQIDTNGRVTFIGGNGQTEAMFGSITYIVA